MSYYIIFGITYAFAAAVQPGPFQTYLISQTLNNGWRSTIPAAFAPLLSDIPIFILIMFILSNVPDWFQNALQICGGLFLIFLASNAFKSFRNFDPQESTSVKTKRQTLLQASIVNILNPHPYIGWSLIMGPLFLKGWAENSLNSFALVGSFYTILTTMSIGIILLFAFARSLGPKVSKTMIGLSSIALLLFGLYQLWSGYTGISN